MLAKLKSKKILLLAAIIIIAAAAVTTKALLLTPGLAPPELAAKSIEDLLSLESLTFSTKTELTINSDTTELGNIQGEINGENLHIQGNVLGSELDIYQIGLITYRKDSLGDGWLTTDDGELISNQSLLNEAEPRAFFRLAALENAVEEDKVELDDTKCRRLTFVPQTESGYWEKYFDEISCTLWIKDGTTQIEQAQICAKATAGGQTSTLTVTNRFWEQNATAPIAPPVIPKGATPSA